MLVSAVSETTSTHGVEEVREDMAGLPASRRSIAIALTGALVVIAASLPAQASENGPATPTRHELTLGGLPLDHLIDATVRRPHPSVVLSAMSQRFSAIGTPRLMQTGRRLRGGGMSRGSKALIGAGIGAAGGAVVGVVLAEIQCDGEGGRHCTSGRAQSLTTGVFALVGAGIGAGIGALLP